MRLLSHTIALSFLFAAAIASPLVKRAPFPQGIDVSNNQGTITWTDVASKGVVWAYIKATEGTCTHLEH
jgi:GH25 family lysozyme M1 (1,4-beta-N-acetylmuramidase)